MSGHYKTSENMGLTFARCIVLLSIVPEMGAEFNLTMNYVPLIGAKLLKFIYAGASPCAIICRPYGTCQLR